MTEKTGQKPQNNSLEGEFSGPTNFIYANALRMYGTGAEVFIEFGRSAPVPPGKPPQAIGEIGVVMSIKTANDLIVQLQTTVLQQLKAMQDQVKSIEAQAQKAVETEKKDNANKNAPGTQA